ncbi:MAG: hypothetical protein C0473_01005 [Cyanobacteria bacterium DS3.002]|nr:hypothetical protein [Cyanobacteria bacterium DS3.002]MBA4049526.1 hypothetical protein [Cyanobacteria bacterium DS2.008]MBA4074790.1 hypothetical protein [Cyanobacteria bacterium PR.023]
MTTRPALLLLLFLLGWSTATPSASAQPLQAGVNETRIVEPALRPGATFYEQLLPQQRINGWYRIPRWYAGTTIRKRLKSRIGLSVKSERTRERGRQCDINGRIWEARREPIVYDIDRGAIIEHVVLTTEQPLEVRSDRVVMRYLGKTIRARRNDNVIVETQQNDEIHTFKPGKDGSIDAQITEGKVFDMDGQLVRSQVIATFYNEQPIAEFRPMDSDERFNYKADFEAFLRQSGKADLIP